LKAKEILTISESTRQKISIVAKDIKGKYLFPEKLELAKKTLGNLKSLPI